MKIVSLHIRNLNSLIGDWSIDFSDPAYEETGFFAITGPTGAGKSTILDAICLALYGKTPRLGRISQTANAIMSTSAGDCCAEVVFSTEKGTFKSTWRQKRAYNKPDRDLQTPVRELSYADTHTLIETKSKDIGSLIEEYTGMDFDRFTRTMMLAQGSFTAFLLAPVKDRSNILEEITGTEIYSDLSKLVFERSKLEDTRISDLQEELQAMKCLSSEEVETIQGEISDLSREIDQTGSDISAIQSQIQWLTTIQTLSQELQQSQTALHRSQQESAEFEEDRNRLVSARRALMMESRYALLRTHRVEREALTTHIEEEKRETPVVREAFGLAVQKEEEGRKNLEEARFSREQDARIARDVRILIPLIHTKEEDYKKNSRRIEEQKEELRTVTEMIHRLEEEQQKTSEEIRRAEEYLRDHGNDALLYEDYNLIESLHADYIRIHDQIRKNNDILVELEEKEKASLKGIAEHQEEMNSLGESITGLSGEINDLDSGIQRLLDGISPEELNNSINSLVLRIRDLGDLQKLIRRLNEKQKQYTAKKGLILQNTQLINLAENERSPYVERESLLAEEISSLERRLYFAQRVSSTGDIRRELQDGDPCPVCGSVHHPYAEGNIPEIGTIASDLTNGRSELTKIRKDITSLTHTITTVSSQNAMHVKENEERAAEMEQDLLAIHQAASSLQLPLPDQNREDAVQIAFMLSDQEREQKKAIQKEVQSLKKDLDKSERAREEELKNLGIIREKLTVAQQEEIAVIRDIENSRKKTEEIAKDLVIKKNRLNTVLSRYGYSDGDPGIIIRELSERKRLYAEYQSSEGVLSREISRLESEITNKRERQEKGEEDLRTLQEEYWVISRELQALTERRLDLYGEKDPDIEEERLKGIESDRERHYVAATKIREENEQILKVHEGKILHLNNTMQSVIRKIAEATIDFHAALVEHGFSSEEEYLSVLLPAAIVSGLEEREKYLNDHLISSRTKAEEKQRELSRQKDLNLTAEPIGILAGKAEEKVRFLHDLQNRVFTKRQIIQDNSRQEEAVDRLKETITLRMKEQVRWGRLNRLIGSSDGTKFRSFAQGLTLSVLLNYANLHLQKLTDRYFLTTKKNSPLEIHVIDNYRAGEIRVAQNLSGGESFIVSLALALGLSAMSSRNVRVDSLFLDEGFGTLDEDSLEVALSTLAGMKQEGKLIGVISHVQSLKERIPVQIVVEKKSGGRSILSGPGCMRW